MSGRCHSDERNAGVQFSCVECSHRSSLQPERSAFSSVDVYWRRSIWQEVARAVILPITHVSDINRGSWLQVSYYSLIVSQLLMTSSLDEFIKGIYEFDRPEIERVVDLFKQLLVVYLFDVRVEYFSLQVDRAVKTVSRALRTMYRFFTSRGFLAPDQFVFKLDWKKEFWGPFM